jgi:hypothetical protein
MIPRINQQGPALCEDDEEDSFDEVDCEGGFYDPSHDDEPEEDEWDEFAYRSDEDDG